MALKYHNQRFYTELRALLKPWEPIILRTQVLLLWIRPIPSLFLCILAHSLFWLIALSNQSNLFIISCILFIYVVFDLIKGKVWHENLRDVESFSFLVHKSLWDGKIISVEDMCYYLAKGFQYVASVSSQLAPCHRRRPLFFFIFSSFLSIGCIWLGRYVSGRQIVYVALNMALILPSALHHGVFTRVCGFIKPYLKELEDEFDRKQLESVEQRDKEEETFWRPIVDVLSSGEETDTDVRSKRRIDTQITTIENNAPIDTSNWPIDLISWATEYRAASKSKEGNDSLLHDADTSEAAFIRELLPKSMVEDSLMSSKFTDTLAEDLEAEEDISAIFSEVLGIPVSSKKNVLKEEKKRRHHRDRIRGQNVETDLDAPIENDQQLEELMLEDPNQAPADTGFVIINRKS